MKKQIKWVTLFSVVTVIILSITAFGLGTEEEPTKHSSSTKQAESVNKETASTTQQNDAEQLSKGEEKKMENAVDTEDVSKTENKQVAKEESETKVNNNNSKSSSPSKTVIIPSTAKANIDAVNNYSTATVNRNGSTVEMHVIVEGTVEELAQFVLPYAQMVKDLNSGVTNVQITLYPTQQAFDQKKPSAVYKDGVLTSL